MHGPVENKKLLENPDKIIVRMPNWIGDLVMATPLLTDLRRFYPGSEITALCQSNLVPLLKNDLDLTQVLGFTKPKGWVHKLPFNIGKTLGLGGYDIGILTTNSFSSAWWFFAGDVKIRIGFKGNLRTLLLNKPVDRPDVKEHQIDTYKRLLAPLGIAHSNTRPRLYLDDNEIRLAKEKFQSWKITLGKNTIIGINPGAAYGSAKCWLPERFKEVTRRLMEDPETYVLYFGDSSTTSLIMDICQGMPPRVINLAGKTTLAELTAMLSLCTAVLSNDSGPMHIASALGVPLVALFGSTDPFKTGPESPATVLSHPVKCAPCFKRVCPIDFRCMTGISVNEVYDALMRKIGKR